VGEIKVADSNDANQQHEEEGRDEDELHQRAASLTVVSKP
jgi:hypothetical protein